MNDNFLYNHKALRERRRELRNNQTPAEKLLWKYISKEKIKGLKFIRQYSAGPYILDFYCSKIRLAVELDGDHHADPEIKTYDLERSKYLKNLDIDLIRFWNNDVLHNIKTVLDKLQNEVEQLNTRVKIPSP